MTATTTDLSRCPMAPRSVRRRRLVNTVITTSSWIAAAIGIFVMGWIVVTVVVRGIGAWNVAFFTQLPPTGNDPGGGLANAIVGLGNVIQAEQLSYKSFQSSFGRSVKVRAPGAFVQRLRLEAESAAGRFVQLPTRTLRLSQFDHCTATYQRKTLSERWHVLGDGSGVVQRDVYSAFLARCVQPHALAGDAVHSSQVFGDVAGAWAAAHLLLGRTGWMRSQCASVPGILGTSPGLPAPQRIVRRRGPAPGHGRAAVMRGDPRRNAPGIL